MSQSLCYMIGYEYHIGRKISGMAVREGLKVRSATVMSTYLCIFITACRDPFIGINSSLPKDAYVHENETANFTCWFSSTDCSVSSKHLITYYTVDEYGALSLNITYTGYCNQLNDFVYEESYSLTVTISRYGSSTNYSYHLSIYHTTNDHNNSILSCSVVVYGDIQWQRNASLHILSGRNNIGETNTKNTNLLIIGSLVGMILTVVIIIVITSFFIYLAHWLRQKHFKIVSYSSQGKINKR